MHLFKAHTEGVSTLANHTQRQRKLHQRQAHGRLDGLRGDHIEDGVDDAGDGEEEELDDELSAELEPEPTPKSTPKPPPTPREVLGGYMVTAGGYIHIAAAAIFALLGVLGHMPRLSAAIAAALSGLGLLLFWASYLVVRGFRGAVRYFRRDVADSLVLLSFTSSPTAAFTVGACTTWWAGLITVAVLGGIGVVWAYKVSSD